MELTYDYSKLDHPDICRVIFHPRLEQVADHGDGIALEFEVEDGVRVSGYFFAVEDKNAPTILFFHGNGEIAAEYSTIAPGYNEQNISFLAVDYRGYGMSNGEPTATNMMKDCHVIFQAVLELLKREERTGPLLVMGRSLGSASAIELADNYSDKIAGIIIESGFALTMPLIELFGVDTAAMGIGERDGFRNALKIGGYLKPMLVLHGQFDQIISMSNAELFNSLCPAKGREFQMVPGADHNTIIQVGGRVYFETIARFVKRAMQKPRKRKIGRR
jgi:alpha-beta hydrolase superfamily lysophospholipase